MASTVSKVRYVRCPKCLKLLIEFADVPVYQCGGCGALLRAKYSDASGDNGTLGALETSNSLKLPEDGSSDNGLSSPGNPCSSAESPEAGHQKGESSEIGENGIKEEESQPVDSIQTETEYLFNEDVDKSLRLNQRSSNGLVLSDKLEETANQDVASEEDLVDRTHGNGHDGRLQSPTRSSRDYDGSVVSSNDGTNENYLPPSTINSNDKRVFGSVSSVDNKEKEGGDSSEAIMNTILLQKLHDLLLSSSNGRRTHSFDSNRAESSSRYRVHTQGRGTSLDSADFYSIQNWMGSELSTTLSRDSTFHFGPRNNGNGSGSINFNHRDQGYSELLRMVDELRDQVSKLYDQRGGKRRPHTRRAPRLHPCLSSNSGHRPHGTYYGLRTSVPEIYQVSQLPLSCHPCCSCLHCKLDDGSLPNFRHNGPCRACAHNLWRHPLVPRHELELDKLHHSEKRQPSKRHCRPLSGAAPFVICDKCLRLLQLPADFLVSRRRLQKLRCSACSEILSFSFRSSDRTTPQTSIEVLHPDSEVDEISVSHPNDSPRGDSTSFSEEFGLLLIKSYSTVAEAVVNDSRNSFGERDGKQAPSSALHHLMGYSSATELLCHPDDEGYESTEPTGPHSRRPSAESHVLMD